MASNPSLLRSGLRVFASLRFVRPVVLTIVLSAILPLHAEAQKQGAFATGHYRNLFSEYLGQSEAATDARLAAAWQQLVAGDPETQRLFYPIADGMAYIPDINNQDVRTEGLSYGMMICVQLDHRREFDELWKFAKTFMAHDRGPLRGYFTWHTGYDGHKLNDAGPAPDGEEWFVTALFFAAHRWGHGEGIFDYEAEAQSLLRTMLHKSEEPDHGDTGSMIDPGAKQIVFVPAGPGAHFTDPSYHLPAFYELWARWAAAPADRATLAQLAPTSRALFKKVAHPRTGLMPDFCTFDGQAVPPPAGRFEFAYDAWRTLSNPALDWSWWAADRAAIDEANRALQFLASQNGRCTDRYQLDGTPLGTPLKSSTGLVAMAACAALAADRTHGEPFVRELWAMKLPEGKYRYYNGLLEMLALLEAGGRFRIY